MEQTIVLPQDGNDLQAHLVLPESGRGPGVLVLHAWWGLNDFFKDVCRRLAEEGFVALAPDLYHGPTAATIPGAKLLRKSLDREGARREIAAWIEYLRLSPAVEGPLLGEIGFSMGAGYALQMAAEKPRDFGAVVVFYGLRSGKFPKTQAAFMAHFAEIDSYLSPEAVMKLEENLRLASPLVNCFEYPGTEHWFFEKDRPDTYQDIAAELAWQRTIDFLREWLPAHKPPQ